MPLGRMVEKLDKYMDRLRHGKADKVKSSHVRQVLEKLEKRETDLLEQLKSEKSDGRKKRLERKILVNQKQAKRARWLFETLSGGED